MPRIARTEIGARLGGSRELAIFAPRFGGKRLAL